MRSFGAHRSSGRIALVVTAEPRTFVRGRYFNRAMCSHPFVACIALIACNHRITTPYLLSIFPFPTSAHPRSGPAPPTEPSSVS